MGRGPGAWSISVFTLLLTPCCGNVLPCLISSSPSLSILSISQRSRPHPPVLVASLSRVKLLRFLSSDSRGEAARRGERHVREKEHALPASCIEPSVSLLSSAVPSTVCPLHPLSSYQSVYSAWHCFLSPHFQRETPGAECDLLHSHGDSGSN